MEIHYIKEVSTMNIDETKIEKCFARANCTIDLKLSDYMAEYHPVSIKETQEFFYVIKNNKKKDARYSWINNDTTSSIYFVSIDGDIWHVLSKKEFEENFCLLAELRDKRINSILDV